VCDAYGRRRVGAFVGSAFGAVGAVAALAGLHAAGIFVAVLGAVVSTWIVRHAPQVLFESPDLAFERSNTQSDGLTDREVAEAIAIVAERNKYEQEQAERERERARRKQQSETPSTRL